MGVAFVTTPYFFLSRCPLVRARSLGADPVLTRTALCLVEMARLAPYPRKKGKPSGQAASPKYPTCVTDPTTTRSLRRARKQKRTGVSYCPG